MKNEKKDGYHKTEIGWIPKDWDCRDLGSVCINGGKYGAAATSIDYSPDLPRYIRITDITDDGRLSSIDIKSIKNEDAKGYLLEEGDFLFARTGATVGKTYLHNKTGNFAFAGYLIRFVPNPEQLLGSYLSNFTQSEKYWSWVRSTIHTGAQPNINAQEYSGLYIPLPSINEQGAIIQILSTWDRAIERVQRLIEAKQRQKDQLVSQLLSGQKRFPGFQDEWKQMKLGAFLHPKFRKVVKPSGAYLRLGIRSHGKGTFTSVVDDPETIALTHLFQARKDDLIVNITFAWEGAIALVGPDGDGALVSHRFPTYVFDTSKMLPEYFKHLMVTDRFFYELDLISPGGAGRNRVMNKGDFLKITVTIPGVEEQKKIASVLGGMDEQIALLKKYLEKLKEQKKGLMQKLLTGEIRVKVE